MAEASAEAFNWENCNLRPEVLLALKKMKMHRMTPVQAACIPVFLKNKDVLVEAVTGSGKTLAFVVPIMEMLFKKKNITKEQVLALIITPTRELAEQIEQVLRNFIMDKDEEHERFSHVLLIGGNQVQDDIKNLNKGANIIIATPGRFEDLLIRQKNSKLPMAVKSLEMLVLDEADRLLDMNFEAQINNILQFLPKQRKTGLFSATMTKELQPLIRAGLRNPVALFVKEKSGESTPLLLKNYYTLVESDQKISALVDFIKEKEKEERKKYIVFFATCASVEWFYTVLENYTDNIFSQTETDKEEKNEKKIFSLHSKMGKYRNKVLERFRNAKSGILLCTDVMARGIDISEVDWVIQFDPPKHAEAFVHRVGRTARNGQTGSSLVFLLPSEDIYVDFLKKNQKIELDFLEFRWKCQDADTATNILTLMRNLQLEDRTNFDRANKAFVSFIQFYSKHECSLIFKLKNLCFGRLATGFGLIRLPKMPEIRNKKINNFTPLKIDFHSIQYRNVDQEKSREKKLEILKETKKWPSKNKIPEVPVREKFQKKKKDNKKSKEKNVPKRKRKRNSKISDEDFASLAKDVALISKLKRRKISEEAFNKQFCGS